MGENTAIEWCHHTFNPWWGCQRVSPGCEHCYAETFSIRLGKNLWGPRAERRLFGDAHWNEPLKWNRAAAVAGERRRVFCASMADVFEDRRDLDEQRARLWRLIDATPALDWLLLTKRPQNMNRLAPVTWSYVWPENVWAGCTVENQSAADERIPHLLATPAAVRFISAEPLLGPIDLLTVDEDGNYSVGWNLRSVKHLTDYGTGTEYDVEATPGIDWVIVGGESGHGARPCALEWMERLVLQLRRAGVAPFVKQLGSYVVSEHRTGPPAIAADPAKLRPEHYAPSGEVWAWRMGLTDMKGGDFEQFPQPLRVREFPR